VCCSIGRHVAAVGCSSMPACILLNLDRRHRSHCVTGLPPSPSMTGLSTAAWPMQATGSWSIYCVVVAKSNRLRHCGRFPSELVCRIGVSGCRTMKITWCRGGTTWRVPAADSLGSSGRGHTAGYEGGEVLPLGKRPSVDVQRGSSGREDPRTCPVIQSVGGRRRSPGRWQP
jgi:hypothetical protein